MSAVKEKLLLLNAEGSISASMRQKFIEKVWDVVGVTRGAAFETCQISCNPIDKRPTLPIKLVPLDAV
jgi:hypothetical protein